MRDSLWFSYVDDVPGFGGMYFDDSGDLVVFLTDTSSESRSRATKRFASYAGKSYRPSNLPGSGHPPMMKFQVGKYNYRQLFDFKENLLGKLASHASLAGIAVDERQNRVRVAVVDMAGATAAASARQAVGASEDAMITAFEGKSTTASDTVSYQYSFSPFTTPPEPLIGGMYYIDHSGWECTLGLMVNWHLGTGNSHPGFLTAEHCFVPPGSSSASTVDSTFVFQPSTASDVVGDLEFNGDWVHSCLYLGVNSTCMHADVALVSTANRADASIRKMFGIAQGSSFASSAYQAGVFYKRVSTYDGTSDGPFIVDSEPLGGAEVVGQWISKLGYRSGWTIGQIVTIGDKPRTLDSRIIRGTVSVKAGIHKGDSGGPVWYSETYVSGNPPAKFDGIVWGAYGTQNGGGFFDHFDFSPIYKVRQQLVAYGYDFSTY